VLRKSRLDGSKFRRQQTLGPYIADFYCESAKLVVELDGVSHLGQKSLDDAREAYFRGRGLEVVRISNDELLKDREGVAGMILEAIRRRKPSPQPSPQGRGSSP